MKHNKFTLWCLRVWLEVRSWFITRYNIFVSYDNQCGNEDDRMYTSVKKIVKQNFKELKFIDSDGSLITIRAESGLKYRIEEI